MRADGAPTFSVVIAAYNAAETIGEAVDSALGQTVAPLEVIVCDDGSTDDIEGALRPYAGRLKLLRKENGGPSSARNLAARAASGEFVAVLDADDVFLPERLEALGELHHPPPRRMSTSRSTARGGDTSTAPRTHSKLPISRGRSSNGASRTTVHCAGRGWGAVGWLDEQLAAAEDWDLLIRLILWGRGPGASTSHSPSIG